MNESELLFTELLKTDRLSLYLNKNLRLDIQKSAFISSVLKRRAFGEPIQYILGKTEFMGFNFRLTKDVLIPRPETEILVEQVIRHITRKTPRANRILELGTGSGCIAISLAKFLPQVEIDATDVSGEALRIAEENAKINNASVNFIESDLFDSCRLKPKTYDLIVSNPPYIPTKEIEKLQSEVRQEPAIALDGGSDGLYFYRKLVKLSPKYLKDKGILIMEMGFNQHKKIKNIFKNYSNFEIIGVIKDYNNLERVIVAQDTANLKVF